MTVELTQIDLKGYGRFGTEPASFECLKYRLPAPWDYCYANGDVLLRIRHDGAGYLQVQPPHGPPLLGGPPLLFRDNGHVTPSLFTWIIPESTKGTRAFTNFWLPAIPSPAAGAEPDEFHCRFTPAAAQYHVAQDDWAVDTQVWVPPAGASMVMTVSITNRARRKRSCTVMPVARPYLARLDQAAWDVPAWYQTVAFCRVGGRNAFWMQTRDAGGNPANRLHAGIITDLACESFEVSMDRFVGAGEWHSPRAVWEASLALRPGRGFAYGRATADNAACGQPPVAAMARKIALGPGGSFEFTMVIGKLPDSSDGCLPPSRRLVELGKYLVASRRAKALAQLRERYRRLFERRRIDTPDAGLSRYANEFLPLQAYWVSMLDRGWPGGFRGTRDAAQDTTSMIGIDPGLARERLIELFSQQRSDGWFPRAYYPGDKTGKAFTATHVDAGVWVWELLREYLCLTRDFDVLKVKTPWMDRQGAASILDRSLGLLDYYLAKENLGPHGLCKIRGGDWNDAVNLAGLEGKGESVMVSCQLVLALEQAADLLRSLAKGRGGALLRRAGRLAVRAGTMRDCLLGHARNRAGYFNGVFSDGGYWVFSPRDPDGRRRISVPANAFAVIAGIVQGAGREEVFDALNELKGPHGWRLFYPAVGDRPIAKLGRIGQGDLAAGVGENGTIYNHGSHGFLGRAAAAAGKGDLLYDVMRHMLPYDQQAHDVAVTRTAPYGVVNHWKSAIGLEGVGGDVFLSGSIATALRNLYEGMAGFRPDVSHLVIDPCLPSHWAGIEAEVDFLGGRCRLRVANPAGVSCGVAALLLDGVAVPDRLDCRRTGRSLAAIPLAMIRPGRDHLIEVTMGGPA